MEDQYLPIRTPDGEIINIDFFRPEDAPGIAGLFRDVYGEHYPIRLYYEPDALIRANESGECCSIVARSGHGQLVGVTHVVQSSPYNCVYESAAGLVLKNFRSMGVSSRLQWFLFHRWSPSMPHVVGLFGEPVCIHTHTQKNWHELGAVEMGVELALMSGSAYGVENDRYTRVGTIAAYYTITPKDHRIYVPDVYSHAFQFLYSGLPEPRSFFFSSAPLPSDRITECRIRIFDFAAVARVAFHETGSDLAAAIVSMEQDVMRQDVEVIQVWLNLGEPWAGAAVDVFRQKGYFLGGILPRWFDDDGLLMQKLYCSPCWDGIHLYTDRSKKILELIQEDRIQVEKSRQNDVYHI